MEPITIFAVSVGLVSVCRLTFVAVDFLGKGIYSRGSKPAKRQEWYCFFKISDLRSTKERHQAAIPDNNVTQKRRPQQRPRLQAERHFH